MLAPDPKVEMPASAWDEPISVDKLPTAMRGSAERDKKTVGDVVNVLRLARCAFTIGVAAAATLKDAIDKVASRPGVAERHGCGWIPSYYSAPNNSSAASYERIDNSHVRVCARFQLPWDRPLALDYYKEALTQWPTSLTELQRPISRPGQECYTVRLTAIGSGVV
jgi:hypothetical protein